MKRLYSLLFIGFIFTDLQAQSSTYAEDIAPIIYKNCSVCHRAGEIGPMSLTNYEEVKAWAPTIKYVTSLGFMPPWQADPEYNHFLGELILTDEEIAQIADWADNGTPRGDESLEPDFPDFPDESLLGEPDLVLEMTQAHTHLGNNRDSYMYFVLPTGLTEDKFVKAVEFRAGNTKIVHHALIFEDTEGIAAATDAMTPGYGFESFGGFGGVDDDFGVLNQKQYPGYTPGQKPLFYPEGIGQTLAAGSDIVVQIHYAPITDAQTDLSKVNIFFADEEEEVDRIVEDRIMLPFDIVPGGFFAFQMPPNSIKTFEGRWTVQEDLSFLGLFPHMHLLGIDWEVFVEHPDGSVTNLIRIPDWDFNWQGSYYFERFYKIEKGSVIKAFATYDNTAENPNQPNDPPKFVSWGEGTNDEMYYLPLYFVPYQEGDENIVFSDGSTTSTEDITSDDNNFIYSISPNPVQGMVNVKFNMDTGGPVNIDIHSIDGKRIKSLRKGTFYNTGAHIVHFQSEQLDAGVYFIKIEGKDFSLTQKFIKS